MNVMLPCIIPSLVILHHAVPVHLRHELHRPERSCWGADAKRRSLRRWGARQGTGGVSAARGRLLLLGRLLQFARSGRAATPWTCAPAAHRVVCHANPIVAIGHAAAMLCWLIREQHALTPSHHWQPPHPHPTPFCTQVTNDNLQEALPAVQAALQACQFFAFDLEMTGLFVRDGPQPYLDEIEDRYRQVRAPPHCL